MKKAKKLESLKMETFSSIAKLTGGGNNPVPHKFTGKLVFTTTGLEKTSDSYHLPEGPTTEIC